MKNIITILSLLFIISCGNSEVNNTSEVPVMTDLAMTCIQQVVTMDQSLGSIRTRASENISLSASINQYIESTNVINMKDCPEDFKVAFKKHQEAWLNTLVITDKYPELRGQMHILFEQISQGEDGAALAPLVKAIGDTWVAVEQTIK